MRSISVTLQSQKPNGVVLVTPIQKEKGTQDTPYFYITTWQVMRIISTALQSQKPNGVVLVTPIQKEKGYHCSPFPFGAGDENRTHNHSLGSCCFATKLHLLDLTKSCLFVKFFIILSHENQFVK